jgi:hypothetical protein
MEKMTRPVLYERVKYNVYRPELEEDEVDNLLSLIDEKDEKYIEQRYSLTTEEDECQQYIIDFGAD